MDLKPVLTAHYHAALDMLAECIRRCPEDLWSAPNPPVPAQADPSNPEWNGVERPFWRIAFHNAYFTHLYMGQNESAFQPPSEEIAVRRREDLKGMWQPPWDIEPYELPAGAQPSSKEDVLEYIQFVRSLVEPTVAALDLESPESGFHWYKNMTKLSHQLMNLRHLQGHVGQLSELLMHRGIDIEWISEDEEQAYT